EAARALTTAYLDRLRQIADPQNLVPGLAIAAVVALARRDETTALSLVAEIDGVTPDGSLSWRHFCLAEATRGCISPGDLDLARRLRRASGAAITRNEHSRKAADAILAEASGSQAEAAVLYSEAADRWQDFSNVVERAHALLGEGRALCLLGRPEASGPL